MATKFFTNEDGNTLLNKFSGVFKHNPQIAEFDALVGYFHSTGYFKIRPFLKGVPQIRILVGINVDAVIAKYKNEGLLLRSIGDPEETKQDYLNALKQEIDDADYSQDLEQSILQFIDDIVTEKIRIKAHPTRKLHAKIYIFRPKEFNPDTGCEVITGSSNLTEAGLGAAGDSSNYEFNVSLRDYDDVKFATDEFEKLWAEAVDILPAEIEAAKNKTFLKDEFTPFELYIKLLIEYFDKEIDFDPNNIKDLPDGFMRLTYQLDAVHQGFEILKKHNGFFLADVVGLGKTIVAILIARQYFYFNNFPEYISQTLAIVPPALKRQWEDTVRKFKMQNVHYETNGRLHKVENPEDYDVVIVDESHKFRNDSTLGYENLQKICKTPCRDGKKKKIILVSATPLNNRPNDIRNQVLLFQDANSSTMEINVGQFFGKITERYKAIIHTKSSRPNSKTRELYADVRDKVIEPLTVRRTRTDLLEHQFYANDLVQQSIVFPDVRTPEKLLYPLEAHLNNLYDVTMNRIQGENGLQYMRYRAIEFLKSDHARDYDRPEFIAGLLAGIMKSLLVKRLDSSFYAFHCTLQRFVRASQSMLKMVASNRIIIAPNHKVEDYVLEENEDELLKKLADEQLTGPGIKILSKDDFKPGFIEELESDHTILSKMEMQWREVIEREEDPKLEKFFSALNADLLTKSRNPEQKLVIFSESLDTTEYLKEKLKSNGYADVLAVNSTNRSALQEKIKHNFDANVALGHQSSDYNIIITTEVLAEGVNLHRANTILNYDTPWNATRLMQRIGRINRIGTKASTIYIYNFFPTEKVEGDIQLRHRAMVKLQAFHSALGEDSQIYSADEQVESFGLFDKKPQGDQDVNERLQYLMEIRKFRQESPDEFERIKNLPLKIRNAVNNRERKDGTISYLRNKKHSAFYEVDKENNLKELSFLQAVPIFKCDPTVTAGRLHEKHHTQVQQTLTHFLEQAAEKTVISRQNQTLTAQQTRAIHSLKAIQNWDHIGEKEKQELADAIATIKIGRFQGLPRDINKLQRTARKGRVALAVQLQSLLEIIRKYRSQEADTRGMQNTGNASPSEETDDLPRVIISQSYV